MAQAPGQPENHPRGLRLCRCIVTSKMCASLWPLAWNRGRRDPAEEEQRGLPAGATEAGAEGVSPRRRQVGAEGPPPPTQPRFKEALWTASDFPGMWTRARPRPRWLRCWGPRKPTPRVLPTTSWGKQQAWVCGAAGPRTDRQAGREGVPHSLSFHSQVARPRGPAPSGGP